MSLVYGYLYGFTTVAISDRSRRHGLCLYSIPRSRSGKKAVAVDRTPPERGPTYVIRVRTPDDVSRNPWTWSGAPRKGHPILSSNSTRNFLFFY